MPKIAIYKFLIFYIFSYDAMNEPAHIHIAKEKGKRQRSAKIWLKNFRISRRGTLTDKELYLAIKIIKKHHKEFIESIQNVKEGKKIKTLKFQKI